MSDLLRQRLQPGDKIRVNQRAKKKYLNGREGVVVEYDTVKVLVDGETHIIVTTSLDVIEPE